MTNIVSFATHSSIKFDFGLVSNTYVFFVYFYFSATIKARNIVPCSLAVCNTPPLPFNGNVSSNGTIAVYSCDQGYSMSGTPTISCSQNGSGWNGSAPLCGMKTFLITPSRDQFLHLCKNL